MQEAGISNRTVDMQYIETLIYCMEAMINIQCCLYIVAFIYQYDEAWQKHAYSNIAAPNKKVLRGPCTVYAMKLVQEKANLVKTYVIMF